MTAREALRKRIGEMARLLFTDQDLAGYLQRIAADVRADVERDRPAKVPQRLVLVVIKTRPHVERELLEMTLVDTAETDHHKAMERAGEAAVKETGTEQLIVAVYHIAEVWISFAAAQTGKPPSENDDRTEAVCVSGRTMDGRSAMSRAPIARDAEGRLALGDSVCLQSGGKFGVESPLLARFYAGYFTGMAEARRTARG
jgi:hypothetical protein